MRFEEQPVNSWNTATIMDMAFFTRISFGLTDGVQRRLRSKHPLQRLLGRQTPEPTFFDVHL
jgi:hypothetical protein